MKKILKKFFLGLLIFLVLIFIYFFVGKTKAAKKIFWGVNFSQLHSQNLGLDWKENYLAILDDLKTKKIKILTHWNLIEKEKDNYSFEDLDWQIKEAQKREANLIFVIGMKTGRWPECHIPDWAKNLKKEEQQKEVLELIEKIVLRYRDISNIEMWQVENEPFFPFGSCPEIEKDFVKEEFNLVKLLDPKRKIIFTDSGEFSFWITASYFGDIIGTTLHRKVYFKEFKSYLTYPFSPLYYWRKSQIIEKLYNKKVICVELQTEPWCSTLLYDCPFEEQQKTMNLEQFKENIEFAKKTGFDTFYLWGAEWWYWLKEKKNRSEIWQEAQTLFY